jgi:hypothetical protein
VQSAAANSLPAVFLLIVIPPKVVELVLQIHKLHTVLLYIVFRQNTRLSAQKNRFMPIFFLQKNAPHGKTNAEQ